MNLNETIDLLEEHKKSQDEPKKDSQESDKTEE